jgi:phospholipid/cholesterol/gamma-HCH transport system ATP-binding protein
MDLQQIPRSPLLDEALDHGGPIVVFDNVHLAFDDKVILHDVSFTLKTGHTKIFLGASGAGKSTILRLALGLLKPDMGMIFVNGERVDNMNEDQLMAVRADLGMVFQEGALFDSLTVRENVGYKLFEESNMPLDDVNRRVQEVLGFVGLSEFIDRMPSELSGGQRRRVAIARAMTAKPRILLYDEPTTGLDPITALTIDEEIIKLRDIENVSSIVVTHRRVLHRRARGVPRRREAPLREGRPEQGRRSRVHHAQGRRDRLRGERLGTARGRGQGPVYSFVLELRRPALATRDQRPETPLCHEHVRLPGHN